MDQIIEWHENRFGIRKGAGVATAKFEGHLSEMNCWYLRIPYKKEGEMEEDMFYLVGIAGREQERSSELEEVYFQLEGGDRRLLEGFKKYITSEIPFKTVFTNPFGKQPASE